MESSCEQEDWKCFFSSLTCVQFLIPLHPSSLSSLWGCSAMVIHISWMSDGSAQPFVLHQGISKPLLASQAIHNLNHPTSPSEDDPYQPWCAAGMRNWMNPLILVEEKRKRCTRGVDVPRFTCPSPGCSCAQG